MQSGNSPFFSVIVPVYNKEQTIQKCIDSVLSQTFADWELILVNDGSKDRSKTKIRAYQDVRIRYIEHKNHGVSYTRNVGMRVAQGDYIHFLDADDYLASDRLEKLYESIISNPADVYFTGITQVNTQREEQNVDVPYTGYVTLEVFKKTFFLIEQKTSLYGYVPTKIIRREFYLNNGLFFDESLRLSEDFDLFLRCYQNAQTFFFIQDYGYYYIHYTGGTTMYNRNVDYFSLIDIQKKVSNWLEQSMSEEACTQLNKKVADFARCAIYTLSPFQVSSIPAICQRIKDDQWLYERIQALGLNDWILKQVINSRYWPLMCYVFIKQSYIRLYQIIHR